MFWKAVHDAFKWIGITSVSAVGGVPLVCAGVAQGFPETKPWFVGWFNWLKAEVNTAVFWIVVLALFGAWLFGLIYSAGKISGHRAAGKAEKPESKSEAPALPASEQQPIFELKLNPESRNVIFRRNAIQGPAKFDIAGEHHSISDNQIGPDAQIPEWPRKPRDEAERREDLVMEILWHWVDLQRDTRPFPFPFPDRESLFVATKDFVNAELKQRGEFWRFTRALLARMEI